MLVYGECECFVMQMSYVCVWCASYGSSQCCVLHNLQFVNNNNNNCLKSNIQCIEIRVQWTVHLGSSHMHVHAVTPKLVICVMYLTSI